MSYDALFKEHEEVVNNLSKTVTKIFHELTERLEKLESLTKRINVTVFKCTECVSITLLGTCSDKTCTDRSNWKEDKPTDKIDYFKAVPNSNLHEIVHKEKPKDSDRLKREFMEELSDSKKIIERALEPLIIVAKSEPSGDISFSEALLHIYKSIEILEGKS